MIQMSGAYFAILHMLAKLFDLICCKRHQLRIFYLLFVHSYPLSAAAWAA